MYDLSGEDGGTVKEIDRKARERKIDRAREKERERRAQTKLVKSGEKKRQRKRDREEGMWTGGWTQEKGELAREQCMETRKISARTRASGGGEGTELLFARIYGFTMRRITTANYEMDLLLCYRITIRCCFDGAKRRVKSFRLAREFFIISLVRRCPKILEM